MDNIHNRAELDQLAAGYISDTLRCIQTVREFCDGHPEWLLQRKAELEKMRDVRDSAGKNKVKSDNVKNSEEKKKKGWQVLKSKITLMTAEGRAKARKKALGCLLQDTLEGLEKLAPFLEAVEKLAVTSLFVYEEENPLCRLPEGRSASAVRSVITAAKGVCPLLIHFQRDHGDFFVPNLVNVDALIFQLEKYVEVSQELCEKLQESTKDACTNDPCSDLTNENIQKMFDHLTLLTNIRSDQHFRMAYLFQGAGPRFVGLFSQCSPRMRQFLETLKKKAAQLDRAKKAVRISKLVGTSMGLLGDAMSTAELEEASTLESVDQGLTVTNLGAGVTESLVSTRHEKKVNKIFQSYREDLKTMLKCLEEATGSAVPNAVPDELCDASVGKTIMACAADELADEAMNFATDALDTFGDVANSVFMGLDLFSICEDVTSLASGVKSDVSKVICATVSLWKTELDAWERIYDSLCIGTETLTTSMEVLERPFDC